MNLPIQLYKNAVFYRDLGYSVIPVYGAQKPDQFKVAAIRWAEFQRRLPTNDEIQNWFINQKFGGIAIVCGPVSRLAVLDFDNADLAILFKQQHPDLVDTRTVSSGRRALPHFYYQIPPHLSVPNRSVSGIDFQFSGRYVVAPPTVLDDDAWTVARDVAPRILTESDLRRILNFLDGVSHINGEMLSDSVLERKKVDLVSDVSSVSVSLQTMIGFYRARTSSGRNNALFETCCWVRDLGGTLDDVMPLVDVHAAEPAYHDHPFESVTSRRNEAMRTIASAFSRQRAPNKNQTITAIPNSLREMLLQSRQTALIRFLEVIQAAGWLPGQQFTRNDAVQIAHELGIGDWTVRRALGSIDPEGVHIFPRFSISANAANAACFSTAQRAKLNAIELTETTPTKTGGRPCLVYVVPDMRDLCMRFSVDWTPGDWIDSTQLSSVKTYRLALHQALVRRRSGQYHRRWLAHRLGVSVRTLSRYNGAAGVEVVACYREQRVLWKNIRWVLPDELDTLNVGAFLEDETGQRYPPLVPIAQRLLSEKHQVTYKVQTCNLYRVPQKTESVLVPTESPQNVIADNFDHRSEGVRKAPCIMSEPATVAGIVSCLPPAVDGFVSDGIDLDEASQVVASRLYECSQGTLAMDRAIDLVKQYGRFAVAEVCDALVSQRVVRNAGAFATYLLKARYGSSLEMDMDETGMAEALYLAVRDRNVNKCLRWERTCGLVKQYGVSAIRAVLVLLRESGDVSNPAGFVIHHLGQKSTSVNVMPDDLVSAVVDYIRTITPSKALSRCTARALVKQYGATTLWRCMQILLNRKDIENPAGFLISLLRSERPAVTV